MIYQVINNIKVCQKRLITINSKLNEIKQQYGQIAGEIQQISTKQSICNGVLERAGYGNEGFGNYVRIREDGTENRIYLAHLSKIYVKVGDRVTYTSIVGLMGATGDATGKHTHVEIREFQNGVAVRKLNASDYMGIPNVLGEYDSANYQIKTETSNIGKTRVFAVRTNIRETPGLDGVAHLYLLIQ